MKTHNVTITEIGGRGDGVALLDGQPVYVPKTAPGDVAEVMVRGDRGSVQQMITPSPDRAAAPCPYFERCGGCSLQHVTPEFYRNWKIAKVQGALARAGVKYAEWMEPVFLPAATRRRTTLAVKRNGTRITMGYNEARSHNVLNIELCLILEPLLDKTIQLLRPFLARIVPDGKSIDIMLQQIDGAIDMVLTGQLQQTRGRFSFEQDEAFGEMLEVAGLTRISWRVRDFAPVEIILSKKPVTKKFGSLRVNLPPAAFLQASDAGEQALASLVLQHAKGAVKIADLFCGNGTFTGHLLQTGAKVTAMDGDEAAIAALAAAKDPDLTVLKRDLFTNPMTELELTGFDTVIFDPPRAGAAAQCERLAWSNIRKIIGISCNPATFARDAATLAEGGYKLQSVTLVDQFVYSAHVEVAGVFVK